MRVWLDGQRRPAFAELIDDDAGTADALGRMVRVRGEGFAAIRVTIGS